MTDLKSSPGSLSIDLEALDVSRARIEQHGLVWIASL